jgi:hypothetical protein
MGQATTTPTPLTLPVLLPAADGPAVNRSQEGSLARR